VLIDTNVLEYAASKHPWFMDAFRKQLRKGRAAEFSGAGS